VQEIGIKGPEKGKEYRLIGEAISLGRSPDNDILVAEQNISRKHLRFLKTPVGYAIEDMGSRNGIEINGTAIKRKLLKNGDKIVVGQSIFQYLELNAVYNNGGSALPSSNSFPANGAANEAFSGPSTGVDSPAGTLSRVARKRLLIYSISAIFLFLFMYVNLQKKKPTLSGPTKSEKKKGGTVDSLSRGSEDGLSEFTTDSLNAEQTFTYEGRVLSEKEMFSRAIILHDSGDIFEAIGLLEKILSANRDSENAKVYKITWMEELNNLGNDLLTKGERAFNGRYYEEAEEFFLQVVSLIPDKTNPIHIRARNALQQVKKAMALVH
jgi:tetratricopeptide (TPR) repeat protein